MLSGERARQNGLFAQLMGQNEHLGGQYSMVLSVPTYDLYGERSSGKPDFWMHCETIASRSSLHQWEIGLHRHDSFFQLLYIRNGSGDALLQGETLPFRPPCVAVVPPGISHGFRFSRDVDGMVITVVADQLRLTSGLSKRPADWLASPRLVVLDPEASDTSYLGETFSRILEEFDGRRTGRNDLIEAHLVSVLLLLRRAAIPQAGEGAREINQMRVEVLQELIGRHFREQLPAEAYARLLNLSPTHLNRLVREVTGSSTHDLIMARVIDEARRALVFTPNSIQRIADNLGFADAAYFSRCFRKRTGLTPREYRETEREKLRQAELAR